MEVFDMSNKHVEQILRLINSLNEDDRIYLNQYLGNAPLSIFEQIEILEMDSGKTFIYEGEKCDKIYILIKGKVKATDHYAEGMSFEYMWFKPVKIFGTMELLLDIEIYRTTLTTATECCFLVISTKAFEKWLSQDKDALLLESKTMGSYLLAQAKMARAYLFLNGKERVMAHLASVLRVNTEESLLKISRQIIADNTGLSIRTVNRAVKELEEEGYFTCKGRGFSFSSIQREQLMRDTEKFWQGPGPWNRIL